MFFLVGPDGCQNIFFFVIIRIIWALTSELFGSQTKLLLGCPNFWAVFFELIYNKKKMMCVIMWWGDYTLRNFLVPANFFGCRCIALFIQCVIKKSFSEWKGHNARGKKPLEVTNKRAKKFWLVSSYFCYQRGIC